MNKKLLFAVITIGFILAITRGWAIFISVPLWAISTLGLIYGVLGFSKVNSVTRITNIDRLLLYTWIVMYITTLLCIVSGGDTPGVWAFGFFAVDGSSEVAHLSSLLSLVCCIMFIALTLLTVFELHRVKQHIKPQSHKKHLIFLVSISIATVLFVGFVAEIIYSSMRPEVQYCNGEAITSGEICSNDLPTGGTGVKIIDAQTVLR